MKLETSTVKTDPAGIVEVSVKISPAAAPGGFPIRYNEIAEAAATQHLAVERMMPAATVPTYWETEDGTRQSTPWGSDTTEFTFRYRMTSWDLGPELVEA